MKKRKEPFSLKIRTIHRYLGFFLAGIMAVYAISGVLMVFRQTNMLKNEIVSEQKLPSNLSENELSSKFKKGVKVIKTEGDIIYFKKGYYNIKTGIATVRKMELPFILNKMEKMHKATTNSPLYFLNIFFGISLLFFVLSAFWMYTPKMPIFKKGMYFAVAGVVLTVVLLFI